MNGKGEKAMILNKLLEASLKKAVSILYSKHWLK